MSLEIITIGDSNSADIELLWFHGYGANNWGFEPFIKVLNLNLGKGFKDLYDEQAFLSPVRIQIKLSQTKPKNLQHQFKIIKKKTAGGEVTHRTLQYLEKLKSNN